MADDASLDNALAFLKKFEGKFGRLLDTKVASQGGSVQDLVNDVRTGISFHYDSYTTPTPADDATFGEVFQAFRDALNASASA